MIGNLPLGGNNPIRIQSMTNTDTNDIVSTARQCIDLANAGCELVRITTQGEREARNLSLIRKEIREKGYSFPLIADIHFNPKVAELAASLVEKVRINPGNYIDRNTPGKFDFTDAEYDLELESIASRLRPLLQICSQNGTAIRIGSNHGSLSNRIMSRYGDTPEGMAESALEFARICKDYGFFNLVLSMKSSNVKVMVHATRLLAQKMLLENMDFPLHLGVTEAGDGEDGILKSAAGIGALLEDGIGDTIRVSLTGDPLKEIPVALEIVSRFNASHQAYPGSRLVRSSQQVTRLVPSARYQSRPVNSIGGSNPVQVLSSTNKGAFILDEHCVPSGMISQEDLDKLKIFSGTSIIKTQDIRGAEITAPILLSNRYETSSPLSFQVNAAIDAGTHLIDGYGDAIMLSAPGINQEIVHRTAFGILQATRARITRTEYISCPSCGRTLFDIEETLAKVKAATGHLKGLKIAVMGCIVNGPGEMADADFGYVGAGKGKVTLYQGKEIVQKSLPESEAIQALVALIREAGRWNEK
jgi:(E)-4-hydroxy-3-methylbut-2-enyl-diphosphate synthase